MQEFRRYAIYDLGPDPLAQFGAAWLGWDAIAGVPLPSAGGEAVTAVPRRYGFHATIKAPFRLAEGSTPAALAEAFAALCATLGPVALPRLTLAALGEGDTRFVALIPAPQPPALTALATRVVTGLDRFRAPLSPAEIARRDPASLDATGRAYLDRWGYPQVLDRFRHHMTLTGPLSPEAAAGVMDTLGPRLAPLLPGPHPLTALALMGEDAEGRFHLIRRVPLGS
ncbi:hypothetical protein IX55_06240 [Paracoccus sanguinis]|nr:DUF1045 domain-containing protein [Paracoccus sanguinis]KGJ20456.1 hypothetical protein IX55_06240 [Paracoccus sanguinis]